jgi:hypothetical protein
MSGTGRGISVLAIILCSAAPAYAETEPERRQLTPREIESWLEAPSGPKTQEDASEDDAEAPPPPPRRHGLTVESGIGALGHLGPLKNISPVSPWFHLKIGFEPFPWLLAFGETDLVFSSTEYAHPPPEPRTYRLYGGGGGLRVTIRVGERLGVYGEGSAGLARVSEDVLEVYGYRSAADFHPYFGGRLGLEWYPVNPHLAIGVFGGLRSYASGLARERSTESALCWLSGVGLRYTF